MSTNSHSAIMTILDQLLQNTEQLCGCEMNEKVDVPALTLACQSGLEALQEIMPSCLEQARLTDEPGSRTQAHRQLMDALTNLEIKANECLTQLRKGLDRTEEEMASLRAKRKAIRAYGRYQ